MQQLTGKAFNRAANFISEHARPLERALFEFHFGSGSDSNVLIELEKFQNEDGGFGRGIEPDLRMPFSSPFSTSVAFQVLRELDVAGDHDMVLNGIGYLERSYDRSIGGWEPTGSSANQFPHAPWWNYKPSPNEGRLDLLAQANPGAELAGYLTLYSEQTNASFVEEVVSSAIATFDRLPDDMEVHVMMCYMRLAEMADGTVAQRLLPKLHRGVHLVTGDSSDDWDSYGGRPLWFATTPSSLLSPELSLSIPIQLDYEIEKQTDDGSWQPNWAWGQYEDDWSLAKVEWAGHLTLRNLLTLKAWDRI
jgi:hypothetical protein